MPQPSALSLTPTAAVDAVVVILAPDFRCFMRPTLSLLIPSLPPNTPRTSYLQRLSSEERTTGSWSSLVPAVFMVSRNQGCPLPIPLFPAILLTGGVCPVSRSSHSTA